MSGKGRGPWPRRSPLARVELEPLLEGGREGLRESLDVAEDDVARKGVAVHVPVDEDVAVGEGDGLHLEDGLLAGGVEEEEDDGDVVVGSVALEPAEPVAGRGVEAAVGDEEEELERVGRAWGGVPRLGEEGEGGLEERGALGRRVGEGEGARDARGGGVVERALAEACAALARSGEGTGALGREARRAGALSVARARARTRSLARGAVRRAAQARPRLGGSGCGGGGRFSAGGGRERAARASAARLAAAEERNVVAELGDLGRKG